MSNTPTLNDDSELRQEILKLGKIHKGIITFSNKLYSNGSASPIESKTQDVVEIGIDDLLALIHQRDEAREGAIRFDELKLAVKAGAVSDRYAATRAAFMGLPNPKKGNSNE